jgi:hypothetical protein
MSDITGNKQFQKSFELGEFIYFIDSSNLESNIDYIKQHQIDFVGVNTYKDFDIEDFSVLLEIKDQVRKLSIEVRNMESLHLLKEFKHLEYLHIIDDNIDIDLTGLDKLKTLYITYHKKIRGLDTLENLEKLLIEKANEKVLNAITTSSKKISHLTIRSSKFNNLSFLQALNQLSELEFEYCSRSSIDVMEIPRNIEVLRLENSKKVENIEALKEFKKLKKLYLINSVQLENDSFVNDLKDLETIVVTQASYFVQGDLSNLYNHKNIKHVGINNKKHYNYTFEDFKKR